jgi:tetratricopeptide (TPR) repeat protein
VAVPGYEVTREIARGGMGVVYAARDPVFDREVAVKVMHPGQDAGRFVVESKVTARLPHPGVPPVHALGTLPDGRPFLALKLIQGHTLAHELHATDRTPDPSRLLGVFEQICQTVGFAHSQGIIHRDLKPANVMLGAFGEVQVMDWGLAKSGVRDQETGSSEEPEGLVATQRGAIETRAGQVKGTPAYMAPEQARGEPVDVRADVFALGAILAEMLTGKPPFLGDTVIDTVLKAAQADLGDCFAKLDACGADAELLALAKRCLAARADDRFADGKEAADAVAVYRTGVEDRLRQAERDRAAAEARAAEEVNTRREAEARHVEQRKKQKVQLALFGVVLLLVCGVVAGAWWQDRQATKQQLAEADHQAKEARLEGERDTEQRLKAEQAREGVRANRKLADDLRRQYKFKLAEAALALAAELAKSGVPELLPEVEQAQRDLAFVVQLDDIRFRKWTWVSEGAGKVDFNTKIASPEYRDAFAQRGLDLTALDTAEAAKRIAASAIKPELVAAVDDWALYEPDATVRNRLLEIARKADPGLWTDRLRDPAGWGDNDAVARLAADADAGSTSSATLSVLATLMERRGLNPDPLLFAARSKHPTDFELAFALGRWHGENKDGRAIGPYEAARALRPENLTVWNNLGIALSHQGDLGGAIAAFKEAIRCDPKFAIAHYNLGVALKAKDDLEGAIAAYKEAIKHDPKHARAHNNLGNALKAKDDLEGAIAAYKEAIKHDPKHARAHNNLGNALADKGNVDGAIAAFEEAIKHDPKHAMAHTNLGVALQAKGDAEGAIAAYKEAIKHDPKTALAHNNLGNALKAKGNVDGAIAAYKEAIKHDPKLALAHNNLGLALADKDLESAIAAFKEAINHDPKLATAHYNLGVALNAKGNVDGAIAAYKEAINHDPKLATAHFNLGNALADRDDVEGAIAAFKEAIRCDPKYAPAHYNLGDTYFQQKRYTEAINCARAAIKANPKLAVSHALLGDALQQTGDIPGARAALTEAARLDKRWASRLAELPPVPTAPAPRAVKRP